MREWGKTELNHLYRYALALTHIPDEAYDLVQDALLRWLETDAGHVESPLKYVMRSLRNLHFDRRRHSRRWSEHRLHDPEPVPMQASPLEEMLIREREVGALLASLRDTERELLYLWAVEGYTVDEISEFTETPRGTLLSRLHRLRRKLASSEHADTRMGGNP